jgi:hypothetical protein
MAYTHGWTTVKHADKVDVFRLCEDEDEYRYLYVGYRDIGLDETTTCLVLPTEASILRITDAHLAKGLVEEWLTYHTTSTEEEYVEDAYGIPEGGLW